MVGYEQIPLVGPGYELQLTLDGRAVPHLEVVDAGAVKVEPGAIVDRASSRGDAPSPDGQITF